MPVVVVPAYQEAPAIGAVVLGLVQAGYPVVVVDDGSHDGTGELAREAGAIVRRHAVNRGQGAALQTGIRAALELGAQIVVTFDADGQHQAADLPQVVLPIQAGRADVVLGSRFLAEATAPTMPAVRRRLLKFAVAFDRWRTGLAITDTHNGLRAFSRRAAERLRLRQDGMAHASELLDHIALLDLRYVEVPVTIRYTDYAIAKGQRLGGAVAIVRDLFVRRWL